MADKIRPSSIPQAKVAKSTGSGTYWTPERRQAQSEAVKRGMANGTLGLFGAPEAGRQSHKKKRRMLEVVADVAAERAEQIADELIIMLQSSNQRKKEYAINTLTRIAESAAKNEREQERTLREMSPEALKSLALERLIEQYGDPDDVIDVPSTAADATSTASEMVEGMIGSGSGNIDPGFSPPAGAGIESDSDDDEGDE